MIQLELTLLVQTIAKRLTKMMLAKNPWGLWAAQGSFAPWWHSPSQKKNLRESLGQDMK